MHNIPYVVSQIKVFILPFSSCRQSMSRWYFAPLGRHFTFFLLLSASLSRTSICRSRHVSATRISGNRPDETWLAWRGKNGENPRRDKTRNAWESQRKKRTPGGAREPRETLLTLRDDRADWLTEQRGSPV